MAAAATAAGHTVVHATSLTPSRSGSPPAAATPPPSWWPPPTAAGYLLRQVDHDHLQIAVDETTTEADVAALAALVRRRGAGIGQRCGRRRAARPGPRHGVHGQRRVPRAQLRNPDAALPAQALRRRLRAGPRHDPAGLVHHEAERHGRDGGRHLARILQSAPLRAGLGHRGHRGDGHAAGGLAGRDHRLRRRLRAAQRRLAGRIRRTHGHPRLPRGERQPGPQHRA